MTVDVETVPMTGRRVTWDGTNQQELTLLVPHAVLGFSGKWAVVKSWNDGEPLVITPGWHVTAWPDGRWTVEHPGSSLIRPLGASQVPAGT